MDVARGLQHQRQHEAVRALQPAARNAAVSGWTVVAQWQPGSVSDAGVGQEPLRFCHRVPNPRIQPVHDQRVRFRLYLHRVPERFQRSQKG